MHEPCRVARRIKHSLWQVNIGGGILHVETLSSAWLPAINKAVVQLGQNHLKNLQSSYCFTMVFGMSTDASGM